MCEEVKGMLTVHQILVYELGYSEEEADEIEALMYEERTQEG